MLGKQLQIAAAGNAGGAGPLGVEDVFSTYLYTGNSSTQTITNGIDLAGEGGMIWIKSRLSLGAYGVQTHALFDTARGIGSFLSSNETVAQRSEPNGITSVNSDGFSLGAGNVSGYYATNFNTQEYASWTFRKAEKFFDVVTYTGTGSVRTVAHNLGSVPGCIIAKCTSGTGNWYVYHRSIGNTGGLFLNSTAGTTTSSTFWNNTSPTATEFTLGADANLNGSGKTFVAYVFAHDAGGFGEDETESVIKCGSYTGNGSTSGPVVNLGWEPQWVIVKNTSGTGLWLMSDSMRGITVAGVNDPYLSANAQSAEYASYSWLAPLPTGFQLTNSGPSLNTSGSTYIYIAIRRGPMKTPTDATEVFTTTTQGAAGDSLAPAFRSSHVADWVFSRYSNSTSNWEVFSRLTGTERMYFDLTLAGSSAGSSYTWDYNNGFWNNAGTGSTYYAWMFRRAPGFFDVVAYTGDGVAGRTVAHNLGVTPELMIVKRRDSTGAWEGYHAALGATKGIRLASDGAALTVTGFWNDTAPTSSVFTVGNNSNVNASGGTIIAYLFATLPGISKVGSYTGTGTTLSIDCGFSAGARFVLIKRTDSTGDWYVWDTARGIVSGNDPYLLMNSNAAEATATDYIDPLSTGFQISSSAPAAINALNGEYIFLAIA